ncbi:uncharacterized protein C20orf85-like [Tribolium madens]|uniref:uncharacterized protein C20orf85-like n=1 Tax=Tribolium madens TaxID=41895 RepID=UPI001CF739BE|nr:uncharacterized protein C20orf85-like [Tribolium madens]
MAGVQERESSMFAIIDQTTQIAPMASLPGVHKDSSLDLVKRNEVLKSLVTLEEKARHDWHRKWGFLLDFDKFVLEEAAKHGISVEEFRRWTVRRKNKTKALDYIWDLEPATNVPKTSSGMVGWRSAPKHRLERTGPLYVSPVTTLPPKERYSCIMLG